MQRPGAESVQKKQRRDFLGGPVAKTLCFQLQGAQGLIPGPGARSHMLQLRPGAAK